MLEGLLVRQPCQNISKLRYEQFLTGELLVNCPIGKQSEQIIHQHVCGFISFVNDNMTGAKTSTIKKKKKIRLGSLVQEHFNLRKKITAFSLSSQAQAAFNLKIPKTRDCKSALKHFYSALTVTVYLHQVRILSRQPSKDFNTIFIVQLLNQILTQHKTSPFQFLKGCKNIFQKLK